MRRQGNRVKFVTRGGGSESVVLLWFWGGGWRWMAWRGTAERLAKRLFFLRHFQDLPDDPCRQSHDPRLGRQPHRRRARPPGACRDRLLELFQARRAADADHDCDRGAVVVLTCLTV